MTERKPCPKPLKAGLIKYSHTKKGVHVPTGFYSTWPRTLNRCLCNQNTRAQPSPHNLSLRHQARLCSTCGRLGCGSQLLNWNTNSLHNWVHTVSLCNKVDTGSYYMLYTNSARMQFVMYTLNNWN